MNNEMNTVLTVGSKLPELSLAAYDPKSDKEIVIKTGDYEFKGKQWSIFFFYPADFTFVCPTELEEMAKLYPKFKELNAEILSFSTDTVFVHKAWHDTSDAIKQITFPMGADPSGKISYAFGTLVEGGDMPFVPDEGLSLRGTFVVDPHGILRTIEIHDNSVGRSAKETFRKLQAAQYVETHEGKVCPASWEPGKDDMEPGLGLVGKI